MHPEQISYGDFIAIAERLGFDGRSLNRMPRTMGAASALAAPFAAYEGNLFYSDPAERAAIVCSRLVRNHPLPDGNKRTGYLCMLVQIDRAGLRWNPPSVDERVAMVEGLAAGDVSEAEFIRWVQANTS